MCGSTSDLSYICSRYFAPHLTLLLAHPINFSSQKCWYLKTEFSPSQNSLGLTSHSIVVKQMRYAQAMGHAFSKIHQEILSSLALHSTKHALLRAVATLAMEEGTAPSTSWQLLQETHWGTVITVCISLETSLCICTSFTLLRHYLHSFPSWLNYWFM